LKPHTYKTIGTALSKLNDELIQLEERKDESDNDRMRYYWFKQQLSNVRVLTSHLSSPGDKVQDLFDQLDNMFSEEGPDAVTLCTIHKSKGLEADVVYILNEYLIPSKFAVSDQQLKQEKNLKYVARTRAKEELYFLNL
jgi:superfamily I DNA/RNA helicase